MYLIPVLHAVDPAEKWHLRVARAFDEKKKYQFESVVARSAPQTG
jgi:hypothetical protein